MPLIALLRAGHPLPSVAVTAFAVGLAVAAGADAGPVLLFGAAVLTGQLSFGWLNDLVDADRDAAAGRLGKPVAAGDVSPAVVRGAVLAALVACVGLSVALGTVPGLLNLLVVACGWAYDLRLKTTALSPLPYLVAFGALPAAAAAVAGQVPSAALVVAAGVLGVAAHFANTVPDEAADAATGVRGLPQRLGARRSQVVAAIGVVAASGTVLAAGGLGAASVLLLSSAAVVGAASPWAPSRWAFRLSLVAAALAVVGVVVAG